MSKELIIPIILAELLTAEKEDFKTPEHYQECMILGKAMLKLLLKFEKEGQK